MKSLLLLYLLPIALSAQVFGIRPLTPVTDLQGFLRAPMKNGAWEINPPVSNPLFVFYSADVDDRGRISGVMALSDYYSTRADGQERMRLALKSLLMALVEKYGEHFGAGGKEGLNTEPTVDGLLAQDSIDAIWSRTYHSRVPEDIEYISVKLGPTEGSKNRSFSVSYRFKGSSTTSPNPARGL